jgi:hypothetical protein
MGEKPRPQEIYRHFKGNLYQIVTIATHSETREEMVVYQALYGDYRVYVRPLDMFMSEVDRSKYPDVRQKMRFERVTPGEAAVKTPEVGREEVPQISAARRTDEPAISAARRDESYVISAAGRADEPAISAARRESVPVKNSFDGGLTTPIRLHLDKKPAQRSEVMNKSIDQEATELNLDPLVIQFMDADLAADKNDILIKLRPTITNDMIDIMAMSVGVVINPGDVYDRYNDLRNCLSTMEKFESTRLR